MPRHHRPGPRRLARALAVLVAAAAVLCAGAARFADAAGGACTTPADCSNLGVCVEGTCECNAGRDGADCSIEINCPDDCGANGVCTLGQCYCKSGFTGVDCKADISASESSDALWAGVIGFVVGAVTVGGGFACGMWCGRRNARRAGRTLASSSSRSAAHAAVESQPEETALEGVHVSAGERGEPAPPTNPNSTAASDPAPNHST